MIQSEKKLKELASVLKNDNNKLIIKAIGVLRGELPFEGAIGLLTSYYNKTGDQLVKKTIAGLMNDLKDQAAAKEVITEIRKQWNAETTSMLISSCWQSGLDYAEYSQDLIDVFLRADYITAIECLTVIEESSDELSRESKDKMIKIIRESSLSPDNEIKALKLELISILER